MDSELLRGTVRGNAIELADRGALVDGQQVLIEIHAVGPAARRSEETTSWNETAADDADDSRWLNEMYRARREPR